ncbi:hypothetical protein MSLAZ_2705 [Methanosarcina lacustris Z-7289]|uniref:DUF366 domain-containing protein n=1 Tax=Methanosarcina lacustris Z-7289 TaxID=1434111 RepID=A0A0E3S674_9EURY|nr:DUF366 family protein [Methanosarcina lacustris]AKB75966.1 hypothetical protein MSLAZ_2705 [Methanosarcina lacustris Z-7289]
MKCIILPEKFDYDGSQISSLWAYNSFGVQEDSIIVFRGACDVKIEHMIDLEDRRANESIWSEDMVSFIIEHFDSTDLKLVYARQRFFTALVREHLAGLGIHTTRGGDDLFLKGKKLTVSIASTSAVSQKIHFGINVSHDVYGNLKEAGVGDDESIVRFMQEIGEAYVREFEDIEKDLRKSRPLGVV